MQPGLKALLLAAVLAVSGSAAGVSAPAPSLKHLRTLTDDTGIFEHATYDVANRKHGYCTEDVARALAAVLMFNRHVRPGDETAAGLARTYAAYLHHAQQEDGDFQHRLDFQRRGHDRATDDSYGRALWGLGYASAHPVDAGMGKLARGMFADALPRAKTLQSPRAMAYSMLGLHYYLESRPESKEAKKLLVAMADSLAELYEKNTSDSWPWFEDTLTYDNAKLPLALLLAYEDTGNKRYRKIARKTLDFLIETGFGGGKILNVIGNRGWYDKGGKPAVYDQQPIDAAAMVEACAAAYRVFGEKKYKLRMEQAFAWFMGGNVSGAMVYDPGTGGSRDGISAGGINENQGAESSIELLIALITLRSASK